jgi:hypothetical protein
MNLFLRFLLISTFFSAQAQQIDVLKLNWKKRTENAKISMFVDGEQRNLYVLAYKPGSLKILRYNAALFLRDSISYNVNENLQKDIRMSFANDSVFIHFLDETDKRVTTLSTTKSFERYSLDSKKLFEDDEISTARFQNGNCINFLVVNKKSKQCLAYTLQGKKLSKIVLNTSQFDTYDNETTFTDFLRKQEFTEIQEQFIPVIETFTDAKCYYLPGKMTFLRTRKGIATLQEIDFNSFKTKVDSFNSKVHQPQNYTAYLTKKELFEISTNKDSLVLIATDLKTKKQLKRWSVSSTTKAKETAFTFFEQRNGGISRQETEIKRFLKRFAQPRIGLSIYESENGKLITMGALDTGISPGGLLLFAASAIAEYVPDDELYENSILYYSEFATDAYLQPKKYRKCVPAIDEILQFNAENKIEINAVTKFQGEYVQAAFISEDQTLNVSKFRDRD